MTEFQSCKPSSLSELRQDLHFALHILRKYDPDGLPAVHELVNHNGEVWDEEADDEDRQTLRNDAASLEDTCVDVLTLLDSDKRLASYDVVEAIRIELVMVQAAVKDVGREAPNWSRENWRGLLRRLHENHFTELERLFRQMCTTERPRKEEEAAETASGGQIRESTKDIGRRYLWRRESPPEAPGEQNESFFLTGPEAVRRTWDDVASIVGLAGHVRASVNAFMAFEEEPTTSWKRDNPRTHSANAQGFARTAQDLKTLCERIHRLGFSLDGGENAYYIFYGLPEDTNLVVRGLVDASTKLLGWFGGYFDEDGYLPDPLPVMQADIWTRFRHFLTLLEEAIETNVEASGEFVEPSLNGKHEGGAATLGGSFDREAGTEGTEAEPDVRLAAYSETQRRATKSGEDATSTNKVQSLSDFVTREQVAKHVHLSKETLRKYQKAWGKPDVKGSGTNPHRWSYRRIVSTLREQFPQVDFPDDSSRL